MKTIEGNILNVEKGIIVQQVNCQGVMGSGLAKSIRDKWPIVYDRYAEYVSKNINYGGLSSDLLGLTIPVTVGKGLWVYSIFGQDFFGTDKRHTNYGALSQGLSAFTGAACPIYFPYLLGCGLGGGDWEVVSELIEFYVPDAIIVRLP